MTYFKSIESASSRQRVSEHEIRWREFSLRVDLALDTNDPVSRLREVKNHRDFSSADAQRDFFEALLGKEREAFERLKETGEFSKELLGCVMHSGQLFDETTSHAFPLASRRAWAGLAAEQLRLLSDIPEWNAQHRRLGAHALGVLQCVWESFDKAHLYDDCGVTSAVLSFIGTGNFLQYIQQGDDPDELEIVHDAILLGQTIHKEAINDQIEGLLPHMYEVCRRLFPDAFQRDDASVSDRPTLVSMDIVDMLGLDGFALASEGIVPNESENKDCSASTDDYLEESEYEIRQRELRDELFDVWEAIFLPSLEIAMRNAREESRPDRADMFTEILVGGQPEEMPGYPLALYALAAESPSRLSDFLPQFLQNCVRGRLGYDSLIGLLCFEDENRPRARAEVMAVLETTLARMPAGDTDTLMEGVKQYILTHRSRYRDAWHLVQLVTQLEHAFEERRANDPAMCVGGDVAAFTELSAEEVLKNTLLGLYAEATIIDGIERVSVTELGQYAKMIVKCASERKVGLLIVLTLLAAGDAGDSSVGSAVDAIAPELLRLPSKTKLTLVGTAREMLDNSRMLFSGRANRERAVALLEKYLYPTSET